MPCKRIFFLLVSITATAHAEPRTTISTDPIGLVSGSYALSFTHLVSDRVALRADGALTADVGMTSGTQELGLGAQLFLHDSAQGPYLEGGLVARHEPTWGAGIGVLGGSGGSPIGGYGYGYGYTTHVVTFGPAVHVGWQHSFPSGMMIAAAIGATRTWASAPSGIDRIAGTSYLRVGYGW